MSTCPSSEYSEHFIAAMLNSMEVSFHKYGPVARAYPHKIDAIKSLEARLKKYKETGNADWLIDIANFAMIEFMHPGHESAHYSPGDSDTSPGRQWHDQRTKYRNNEGDNVTL